MNLTQTAQNVHYLLEERSLFHRNAQHLSQLADEDHHSDAGLEAGQDRN